MWPLILPLSSCNPESAGIIRLLISIKNQMIRVWYEKIHFHLANTIQEPAAIISKLHGYFDLFYQSGLASNSFFLGKEQDGFLGKFISRLVI